MVAPKGKLDSEIMLKFKVCFLCSEAVSFLLSEAMSFLRSDLLARYYYYASI